MTDAIQVTWDNRQITCAVTRVARKTVAITVTPDTRVIVRAPLHAEDAAIRRIVERRAGWIQKQQRYFQQFQPRTPAREYVGGESHLYLGRRYRLRVREGAEPSVAFTGGYLCVWVPHPPDPAAVKTALDAWYAEKAAALFPARLDVCRRIPALRDLPAPRLTIRPLAKRWGSCTASGRLTLNTGLIRAPRVCIDYVIVHELCHLTHLDHSRDFYRLLETALPDWEERKLRLERLLS